MTKKKSLTKAAQIRQLFAKGVEVSEIMKQTDSSRPYVHKVVSEERKRQKELSEQPPEGDFFTRVPKLKEPPAVEFEDEEPWECGSCHHQWLSEEQPKKCPKCGVEFE